MNKPQRTRDAAIREAQAKVMDRMNANPQGACSTITATGRIREGLACTIEQGTFSVTTDLGPAMGGDAAGPSPGFFARAGIAGCVAIAVKMAAARAGKTYRSVEVQVSTDFDDLALFGLGASSAAPVETRVEITIDTDEDMAETEAFIARVLEMDPWYLALRDPQCVIPSVRIGKD